jgi:hypothetical protein
MADPQCTVGRGVSSNEESENDRSFGLSVFFCTDKIQGGQDHAFMFRDGLVNYNAHYSLS